MLTNTNAYISIGSVQFQPSREDFLSTISINEAALEKSLEDSAAYGKDLLMFGTGDLFVEEQEFFVSGDTKAISGLLNYAQAITHRLMTTRGTHPEDRFFGVPWNNYIGQAYSSSRIVKSRLISDITEELYKDRRTREVAYVRASFESPTVLGVECAVIPIRFQAGAIEISLTVEGADA